MTTVTRTRMSAEERREEILDAAVSEFAVKGMHGTSTETIARRVGISQPYLFRLYGTKKGLFLAAVERGFARVHDAFRLAAEMHPDQPLAAMADAYKTLLQHKEELLLQLQAYAACGDPEVEAAVRAHFADLYRFVERTPGVNGEEVSEFFAHGMLLNVAAAMDLLSVIGLESWVGRCLALGE